MPYTTPLEPSNPEPPNPKAALSIFVRDLWEDYGGTWEECQGCNNLNQETCDLQEWKACPLLREALVKVMEK